MAKRLAALGLAALNVFFVYYALLTGYRRGLSWQRMYLVACLIQFAVEILLFETMECVWINCAIPILVSSEVRRVGDDIVEVVHDMCSGDKLESQYFLNAPDYLFVSTNIAKKFPQLMESIVVRMYTNHLPGEMAKIWQVGSVARINRHERIRRATVLGGVIALLQYLGTAPFVLHRMFVRFLQPFVFSAVVLFWKIIISNPIYVGIAAAVVAAICFYCVYMYYVDKHVYSSINGVAPVLAEYEGEESDTQKDAPSSSLERGASSLSSRNLNADRASSSRPFGSSKARDSKAPKKAPSQAFASEVLSHPAQGGASPEKSKGKPSKAKRSKARSGENDQARSGEESASDENRSAISGKAKLSASKRASAEPKPARGEKARRRDASSAGSDESENDRDTSVREKGSRSHRSKGKPSKPNKNQRRNNRESSDESLSDLESEPDHGRTTKKRASQAKPSKAKNVRGRSDSDADSAASGSDAPPSELDKPSKRGKKSAAQRRKESARKSKVLRQNQSNKAKEQRGARGDSDLEMESLSGGEGSSRAGRRKDNKQRTKGGKNSPKVGRKPKAEEKPTQDSSDSDDARSISGSSLDSSDSESSAELFSGAHVKARAISMAKKKRTKA
jgi:hypothetical protein